MCISTTTLTSSPSGLTAAGQKQEACSSTGSLTRPSPSDRPRTTPSSLTLSLATRPPTWSEADTLLIEYLAGEVQQGRNHERPEYHQREPYRRQLRQKRQHDLVDLSDGLNKGHDQARNEC